MTVYKVVTPNNGRLYSGYWRDLPKSRLRRYAVGKTTKPFKGTKLFAFESLEDARRYANAYQKVFKAEATGISHRGRWIEQAPGRVSGPRFFSRLVSNQGYRSCVLCDTIELVEEVKCDKLGVRVS